MTTADIVNLILQKFGPSVRFIDIDERYVEFNLGCSNYFACFDHGSNTIDAGEIDDRSKIQKGYASDRMSGILNGWKRDESGVMVKP